MNGVKLSLCIATFNRAAFIGETLDSLIPQLNDSVEIVILDGGSTDKTGEVVRKYVASDARVRYFRQATNLGVDRDFDRAVQLAAGEYCWLMSDDDLVKPGAIARVQEALRQEPSLVIVNAEVHNKDFSRLIVPRRLRFDFDRVYGPAELSRLFAETGTYAMFIGCVVIKRSVWMERAREPYYGSLFIHIGVIFQHPLPGDTRVIAEPQISIRYGNAMWTPRQFEVLMLLWPSLVWSLPAPSEAAKASLTAAQPWRQVTWLLFFRATGAYSLMEYRRWIAPRTKSLRERLMPALVSLLPGAILNPLALFYLSAIRSPSAPGDAPLAIYEARTSRYYFANWFKAARSEPR
jgi:abequosyltransferase